MVSTNRAPRRSAAGATRRRTASIRSRALPFVTRKRTDSGNRAPSTGASASGASPPPTSRTRQPSLGSTRAATRPATADPSVKPQNIRVTSDDRRAVGQNSDASVIVIGIAPPRPRPVRKRNAISDVRPPLYDDARLAAPNRIIDATSIVLRPRRSASGPTAKAPSISPNNPAANNGPSCATPSRHSARIAGAMNPMIAVSKPSTAITRKQRNSNRCWSGDTRCPSMHACTSTTRGGACSGSCTRRIYCQTLSGRLHVHSADGRARR